MTILIPRNSQYHTTYAFYTVTHIKTIIFWLWLRLWLWLSSLSLIRGGVYDHFPGNSKISNFILILKKCRPLQSSGPTWSPIFFKWLSLKILRYHCGQTSHNEWYYLVCLCSPRQTNIVNVFLVRSWYSSFLFFSLFICNVPIARYHGVYDEDLLFLSWTVLTVT